MYNDKNLAQSVIEKIEAGEYSDSFLSAIIHNSEEIERLTPDLRPVHKLHGTHWLTDKIVRDGNDVYALIFDQEESKYVILRLSTFPGGGSMRSTNFQEITHFQQHSSGAAFAGRDDHSWTVATADGHELFQVFPNEKIDELAFINKHKPAIVVQAATKKEWHVDYGHSSRGQDRTGPNPIKLLTDVWGEPVYAREDADYDILYEGRHVTGIDMRVLAILPVIEYGEKHRGLVVQDAEGACFYCVTGHRLELNGPASVITPSPHAGFYFAHPLKADDGWAAEYYTLGRKDMATFTHEVVQIFALPVIETTCVVTKTDQPGELELQMFYQVKVIDQGTAFRFVQSTGIWGSYLYGVQQKKKWHIKWGRQKLLTVDDLLALWLDKGTVKAFVRNGRTLLYFERKMTDRVTP